MQKFQDKKFIYRLQKSSILELHSIIIRIRNPSSIIFWTRGHILFSSVFHFRIYQSGFLLCIINGILFGFLFGFSLCGLVCLFLSVLQFDHTFHCLDTLLWLTFTSFDTIYVVIRIIISSCADKTLIITNK
jgi:hypothetical protein